ncbi:MAG: hypothetical protein ACLFNO_00805 [Parcubacteria group bacterium]
MSKRPKLAHEVGKTTETESKKTSKKEKLIKFFQWPGFKNNVVIAILVIIGTIIWFYTFQNLIQYMAPWLYLVVLFVATFVVSTFFSRIFNDHEQKKRKLVKWLPILLVFVFHFLPSLDRANFNPNGDVLNWINIENGEIFHRPSNEIHEDNKGEYFFDPITGDTCRKATDHWLEVYREKNPASMSVYVTEYDTLINEIYSSHDANSEGILRTNVYGYDLNKLESPEIVIINLKSKGAQNSVVIGHVNTCVDIYASYRQPEARYKYKDKVVKNLDLSIPLTFKGPATKAQVLVLEKTMVKQTLVSN